jgi:D-glycero-D-manno-heptose 1,7-bisphosphate phosphatase
MSTQPKSRARTRAKGSKQRVAAFHAPSSSKGAPAVFLDRDGTICEEVGYVNHLDRIRLFPWSAEAIRKLNQAGLPVVVVTNQSGVGRGFFSEDLVKQANVKIAMDLASSDARLEAFYYCPHHPTATIQEYRKACRCRKPATGMLEEAAKRFNLDLKSSYVIGDSYRDAQLAFNIGARSILVMTGYGKGEYEHHRRSWPRMPDMIAENLLEAVEKILNGRAPRGATPRSRAKRLR